MLISFEELQPRLWRRVDQSLEEAAGECLLKIACRQSDEGGGRGRRQECRRKQAMHTPADASYALTAFTIAAAEMP